MVNTGSRFFTPAHSQNSVLSKLLLPEAEWSAYTSYSLLEVNIDLGFAIRLSIFLLYCPDLCSGSKR